MKHGIVIEVGYGQVMVMPLRRNSCGMNNCTVMSLSDLVYDDMSDPSAPADFAAVGAEVKAERAAGCLPGARQKEAEG